MERKGETTWTLFGRSAEYWAAAKELYEKHLGILPRPTVQGQTTPREIEIQIRAGMTISQALEIDAWITKSQLHHFLEGL